MWEWMLINKNKVYKDDSLNIAIELNNNDGCFYIYDTFMRDVVYESQGILKSINSNSYNELKEFFRLSDDDMDHYGVSLVKEDTVSMDIKHYISSTSLELNNALA